MRYLSACSGIEAATVAWHPLGWTPVAFAEIEPFPCAVLAHHYPSVPNWGDMTKFREWPDANVDVLVGGTPCQSFSVAGLRAGLSDPRGNLALTFLAIADRYRPKWVVWENVPGVLSADSHVGPDPCPPPNPVDLGCDGAEVDTEDEYDADEVHAFACLLAGFSELGYFGAYGTLDAQYFNLAQRRARVFAVFHLGNWTRPAAVLFDRASLSGDLAPRREAGERVADSLTVGANQCSGTRSDFVEASTGHIAHALNAGGMNRIDYESETFVAHALRADGFDASEDGTGRGTPLVAHAFDLGQVTNPTHRRQLKEQAVALNGNARECVAFSAKDYGADAGAVAPTLRAGGHTGSHANGGVMPAVAFQSSQSGVRAVEAHATLDSNNGSRRHNGIVSGMAVRRLTPRECARLQGFPDDYLDIPYRGKPAADGPKYKALGNSMAVPVMAWIGERIALVESITGRSER